MERGRDELAITLLGGVIMLSWERGREGEGGGRLLSAAAKGKVHCGQRSALLRYVASLGTQTHKGQ